MALHEKMKLALIAEELFGYFIEKGSVQFTVHLDITEEASIFTVTIYNPVTAIEQELRQDLYCERDYELEEYGWELHSESESTEILHALSLLVDYYDIEQQTDSVIIKFFRNNKQK